ncbi:hypothetical protein Pmani_006176 [Petrolisthes manimaculis]|uniref:Serine protease 12 n=1 Tax=Petrolisthes manimaculis TaxID=1843537 RepID=A0AAE1QAT2_9EUCA|nr:hypothetical protein Pmani_006176 [Petrolisthes manimaculis]
MKDEEELQDTWYCNIHRRKKKKIIIIIMTKLQPRLDIGLIGLLLDLLLITSVLSQTATSRIQNIRLSGGNGAHEGNVEVQVDRSWGYICDDGFGFVEADAVCRQLGYNHAQTFTRNNHFGVNSPGWRRGSVKFWLDRVNCSQSSVFKDCVSGDLGKHDCTPTEIAGVVCVLDSAPCPHQQFPCVGSSVCLNRTSVCDGSSDCPDESDEAEELCEDVGVTRLVNPSTDITIPGVTAGVVFVKHEAVWGTVCDDKFTHNDAKVVCRNLGYFEGWSVAFTRSYLGRGNGKIWLAEPGCTGDEEWLGECPATVFTTPFCSHNEDISVFCYDGGLELRLVDGSSPMSGRVEARLGGDWGSVCGTHFDDYDARVVCKMLGYTGDSRGSVGVGRAAPGNVWNLHLDCLGHEEHLQQCRIKLPNDTCQVTNTAAVTCSNVGGDIDRALQSIQPEDCGQAEDATQRFLTRLAKVRGGSNPSRFDAPWLVSLRTQTHGRLLCGGTIISEYYVVTAAHCLRTQGSLNLIIRVGDYNSNYKEDEEEDYFIDKIWQHEEFDILSFDNNDIALLKVEPKNGRGIRFGSRVKPICLPQVRDLYQDLEDCTIIGWGPTFISGEPQTRPREGKVSVLEDRQCEEIFSGGPSNFSSSFVCAGNLLENVNSCSGDSGGPMACQIKGRRNAVSLYGIVSTGFSCKPGRSPDNLARVTKYLGWIHDKIFGSL